MLWVDEGVEGVGGKSVLEAQGEGLDSGLEGGVGGVGSGGDEGGGDVGVLGGDDEEFGAGVELGEGGGVRAF